MTEPVKRILIADRHEQSRAELRQRLEGAAESRYTYFEAGSVDEAIQVSLDCQPHCILLDSRLAASDGLDFLRALRSRVTATSLAIVFLTDGAESIVDEAMKAEVQDCLARDKATSDLLARVVRDAINRAESNDVIESQRAELQRLREDSGRTRGDRDQMRRELEEAKAEAENANAAKDEFLAAISHELRTPLTPILSAVSAIDPETTEPSELVQLFDMIERNIAAEARLIDDLLDLTRVSRGKLRFDLQPIKLEAALQSTIAICYPDFARKNILLEVKLLAPDAHVMADAARLQQVFWNLFKNSVKFTDPGGKVEISTQLRGQHIEVTIHDTGIGIDPEILPRIFNPFEQGDRLLPRKFGGLGLGLAISKALVRMHGGEIRAESDGCNRGATFRVILPLIDVPSSPLGRAEDADQARADRSKRGGNVLLVEDHDDTASVLASGLRRKGFKVRIASSVESATICFRREPFDLVICDIGLPDGSGTDLLQRIKKLRPVPAIALSGYGLDQDMERSREAGFVEHLTKPVGWESLLEAVDHALAQTPAG